MISYAQNREDVVLARALADQEQGFYIDIGAFDPTAESVTRHFYELGWSGISVEPVPSLLARFAEERPRDANLGVGVLDECGEADFWECLSNPGGSTFDRSVAQRSTLEGRWQHHTIPITTLAAICEGHVGDREIDFLKVDAEGSEARVLRGADWQRWRPRIVVVEATRPHSPSPTHHEWEPGLLKAGYVHALFDGLNRFYTRVEEPELLELLDRPACVFDDYEPNEIVVLRAQLDQARAELGQTTEYAQGLEAALRSAQALVGSLEATTLRRTLAARYRARFSRRTLP